VRYVITEKTVRGGEAVKQSMTQPRAPLSAQMLRRLRWRLRSISMQVAEATQAHQDCCPRRVSDVGGDTERRNTPNQMV
jgi:hypothetical protein